MLEFWQYDADKIRNDPNIHLTVSSNTTRGVIEYNVLNSRYLLGGIQRNDSGYIIKAGLQLMNP